MDILTIFSTPTLRHMSLLAVLLLGGCGGDELSREAVSAMDVFERLLQQAATTDTEYMFAYEKRFTEVRHTYGRVYEVLMAIPGKRERMRVVTRMDERLQESIVARPSSFKELGFHIRSRIMFDAIIKATWDTTGDEHRIFALWERRRRKCNMAAERCVMEKEVLKKEYWRLWEISMTVAARLAKVKTQELTDEEMAMKKEFEEKEPKIMERLRGLDFLPSEYRTVIGDDGKELAGGKLYERFQKLSARELEKLLER